MPDYPGTALSNASGGTIWAVLVDANAGPLWTPIDELVVDRSENQHGDGLGARAASLQGDSSQARS